MSSFDHDSISGSTLSLPCYSMREAFGSQNLVQVGGPTSRTSFILENVTACRFIVQKLNVTPVTISVDATLVIRINSSPATDLNGSCRKRKHIGDGDGRIPKQRRVSSLQTAKQNLIEAQRAAFEAKYQQLNCLGEGGCGSVFTGYNKASLSPVAIKHVTKENVLCKIKAKNGKQLSSEVAVMLKISSKKKLAMGKSAPVALLDWYDLGQELILVLERPVPCKDLHEYCQDNGGSLVEEQAKIILKQLVDAAKDLEQNNIFHRDIKQQNILIETSSNVPQVRLIDFGLSCFFNKRSSYSVFFGTTDHMPPESMFGSYKPGPTTVWQIGVVLYETLHPGDKFETIGFLRNEFPIQKGLSRNCQKFLKLCLARKPEHRPTLAQLQRHNWLQ